jgi:hypothetical protein
MFEAHFHEPTKRGIDKRHIYPSGISPRFPLSYPESSAWLPLLCSYIAGPRLRLSMEERLYVDYRF